LVVRKTSERDYTMTKKARFCCTES